MHLTSLDVPQADRLETVVQVIMNIANGARSDVEIIRGIPGLTSARQGRYYRNAAELLGFVENHANNAELTASGNKFVQNPSLTNPDFIAAVLRLEVVQRLIPYLELAAAAGATRNEIVAYLRSLMETTIGLVTLNRRVSTLLSWLQSMDVVRNRDNKFYIATGFTENLPVMEIEDEEQRILPKTGALAEYKIVQERIREAKASVEVFRNEALMDRARISHRKLINITSERIRANNGIPKSNSFIDLAVSFDKDFIFEMKSTTEANIRSQVRKGISQLYEYRYLEDSKDATLVLVIENPLNQNDRWMHNYLETDREVLLIWDGDERLFGSDRATKELPFLGLNS